VCGCKDKVLQTLECIYKCSAMGVSVRMGER